MTILEIAQCQNFRQMTHKNVINKKKYVIKHILKHQIGIFYAVYEIKCVKNLQLNVFKCMLALSHSLRLRTINRQFEPILPLYSV